MRISSRMLVVVTAILTVCGAVCFGIVTYLDSVDSPTPFNFWENNLVGLALLSGAFLAAISRRARLGSGAVALGLMLTGIGVGELIGGHVGARTAGASEQEIIRSWMPVPPTPGSRP
jgi:hypothetical protein